MMKKIIIISCFILIPSCSSDSKESKPANNAQDKIEVASWKSSEKEDALLNCINSGNPQGFCECSVSILTSLLSYSEFKSFDSQIRSGLQPASIIGSKMIEMGKRVSEQCKKE